MPKAPATPALLPGDVLVEVPVTLLIPVKSLDARTPREGRAFAQDILRAAKRKAVIGGVEIRFRIQP
jgi:hypothetical protein